MKRCTPEIVLKFKRIACYRAAARARRTSRKHHPQSSDSYVRPGELIVAPESINLSPPHGVGLVKFIRAVSATVLRMKTPTRLDFRKTQMLDVSGTILLYAEIDRITKLSDLKKPITILEPRERRPREVLKQIGIHHLTGDSSDIVPEREDVVFWKATKGSTQSGDALGSLLERVAERVNRDHVKKVELNGIWRGVSEAVANTVDHAYEKPRSDGFPGLPETKWWMFTQLRENNFTAAVCDLGCGYSETVNFTIPESFLSQWRSLLPGMNLDSIAIQTAMEYGRSGTRQSNRGKGSRDALSVLRKHGTGTLTVLSNAGWVQLAYEGGEEVAIDSGDIGIDIRGTILWWHLPLLGE